VVVRDADEVESAVIAADLVWRACIRERIGKGRQQRLILHADNAIAIRPATLEVPLELMGVLRSFERPRVSIDNPYSESLFRTVKYRPDHPPALIGTGAAKGVTSRRSVGTGGASCF
jgi:transposase InsO family protein